MKKVKLHIHETDYIFENLEDAQLAQLYMSKSKCSARLKHKGIYSEYKDNAPFISVYCDDDPDDVIFESKELAENNCDLESKLKLNHFAKTLKTKHFDLYGRFTIRLVEAKKLRNFCKKHELKEFFVCKDHGVYIGAIKQNNDNDSFEKSIHYVPCCDPDVDLHWYNYARNNYTGDDFSFNIPVEWLDIACRNHDYLNIEIVGDIVGLNI